MRRRHWPGALAAAVLALWGCGSADRQAPAEPAGSDDPQQYAVIDCLLAPQMIRMGEAAVRFTPSRLAKMSARQCARQGGARKEGLDAWKQLAESGNAEAQVYLGEMYEHGTGGVARDLRSALDWYQRAAKAGNPRAISNLAVLYANGAPGLPKDPGRAADLVKQSAAATGADTRNFVVEPVARSGSPRRPATTSEASSTAELRNFNFGKYHALLIGNAAYRHLPPLRSPTNEIDVIGRLLESRYGFRVTKMKNATRDQILRQLDDMDAGLEKEDNLLVYYSGHGAESETGEGYWIPVDGEAPTAPNRLRTRLWVPTSDLREKLSVFKSGHVLVVSDSCYSGRLLQFRGGFTSRAATPAGIAPSASYLESFTRNYAARSRMALTSGGLAPVIEPNDGSNLSLFAKAFIQFLERNREPVRSVDIFAGIQQDVVLATSRLGFTQEPQWGAIGGGGHESGDFWFRPR